MAIPNQALEYLRDGALTGLWEAIASKLERNGLSATGTVRVVLSPAGASQLSGLLGSTAKSGTVTVKLPALDERFRGTGSSLVTVVEQVRRTPLIDRKQATAERAVVVAERRRLLDDAVTGVGFSAVQAQSFVAGVRAAGLLTRAGADAGAVLARFGAAWAELARSGVLEQFGEVEPTWLLGEFAFRFTGTSHGFDDGTTESKLMMRALAVISGTPVPTTSGERRRLWALAGVSTDEVSGTAMTWGFRPDGTDAWSAMMRDRAVLGVVTHLTVQELTVAAGVRLAARGTEVFACENPQVLQAAASAGVRVPVLCLSGQGSAAAWMVLRQLLDDGVVVRYHGDFDWPGVGIAGRVHHAGGTPWRMRSEDYLAALTVTTEREPLDEGRPTETRWDPRLAVVMAEQDAVAHEESVISALLADLAGA
jgi:uncharacterized protein (TIGR02679 family)